MSRTHLLRWAALAALVFLQMLIGVVYKLSQKSGATYSYSTLSALAIAEALKFCISAFLRFRDAQCRNTIPLTNRGESQKRAWTAGGTSKILALALMYCVNNQLTFSIFQTADPATFNIFKSTSTLITAAISCVLLARHVSWPQWAAIVLQVCGLFVTQYDACKDSMLLPGATYVLLLISVTITALSGVWNEHQLKTMPLSLHEQNMVLYAGGFVMNAVGHFVKSTLVGGVPGFFAGYDAASIAVVAINACFGIVVTAVYKYADAVMKCLASAVTTVMLLGVSWLLFGLRLNATMLAGCAIVVVAVALYSTTPHNKNAVASERCRLGIAICMGAVFVGCYAMLV